jgi:hypothetical protein
MILICRAKPAHKVKSHIMKINLPLFHLLQIFNAARGKKFVCKSLTANFMQHRMYLSIEKFHTGKLPWVIQLRVEPTCMAT